ncbi:hypothetical protein Ddye_020413 [Dipteronia dyeriana]|uniref:Bet v I/Major latex protein domain-containing protein n=1 Tax=Dipteronia dyeriana TaxID=168575 RepID=A0AAD9U0I0_9ROSI|nr:hypothetical protein Ddye_020413 [Dipteronia dyeriana]
MFVGIYRLARHVNTCFPSVWPLPTNPFEEKKQICENDRKFVVARPLLISTSLQTPITVERLWRVVIVDAHNLMPKILPQIISSSEGDGGVGTIKKFKFTDGKREREKGENHAFKYYVVGGGLVGLKDPVSDRGGCLAKLKIEYESLGDTILSEEDAAKIISGTVAMLKVVDEYLLENFNAYA